jgi:uncharacterized protein YlxW (UPF0749 family)
MPDPTSAAGATPEGGATPPAGESTESNGSATTADDGLGDAGRRALSEVRKELKAAQKERDDLAAKVREREDAEKSEPRQTAPATGSAAFSDRLRKQARR